MIKVFMSHAEEDAEVVDEAISILEKGGQIKCWSYRRDGEFMNDPIDHEIEEEIKTSNYFIIFFSEASLNSKWVSEEYGIVINRWKAGIKQPYPFRLKVDEAELPERYKNLKYHLYSISKIDSIKSFILKGGSTETLMSKESLPVTDIMTPKENLITISADATLARAYVYMDTAEVRHLIVINDDGTIEGFMSNRDVYRHLPPKLNQLREIYENVNVNHYREYVDTSIEKPITSIMTHRTELISLPPTASAIDAIKALVKTYNFGRISAIPIIDANHFVLGVASYIDLLCKGYLNVPSGIVGQFKKKNDLIIMHYGDSLEGASITMSQFDIRHLPIENNRGELVGMIDDIRVKLLTSPITEISLAEHPIEKFMEPISSVICLYDNDSIASVIEIFCKNRHIGALPVVEELPTGAKKLTGILSYVDILKAMLKMYESG